MDYTYIYKYKEDTGYDVSNHCIDNTMYYSEDYVEWLQEQLKFPDVTQRSELLLCGICEIETEHIVYDSGNLQCKKCDWVAKP